MGCGVLGVGCRLYGVRCRVWGVGCRMKGGGLRDQGGGDDEQERTCSDDVNRVHARPRVAWLQGREMNLVSPSWCAPALFRAKVNGCVLVTQHVNLRIIVDFSTKNKSSHFSRINFPTNSSNYSLYRSHSKR